MVGKKGGKCRSVRGQSERVGKGERVEQLHVRKEGREVEECHGRVRREALGVEALLINFSFPRAHYGSGPFT